MTKLDRFEAFVEKLRSRADVLAVILFGSYARGDSRPDSDIDLLAIVTEGYQRGVEYLDGQAFEVIYVTEKGSVDHWKSDRHGAASLWEVAQVVFDKDGTGERLKQAGESLRVERRPAPSPQQIAHFRFDQEDAIRAVEALVDGDRATAALLLQKKVAALIEFYFDIKRSWIPAPKQLLGRLREENPPLAGMLDRFFVSNSLKEQIDLAKQFGAVILKDSG
jgi:predicted nucleotidyltransferase